MVSGIWYLVNRLALEDTVHRFLEKSRSLLALCLTSGSQWCLLNVFLSLSSAGQAELCRDDRWPNTHTQFKCHLFCEAFPDPFPPICFLPRKAWKNESLPQYSCCSLPISVQAFISRVTGRGLGLAPSGITPAQAPLSLSLLAPSNSEPQAIHKERSSMQE